MLASMNLVLLLAPFAIEPALGQPLYATSDQAVWWVASRNKVIASETKEITLDIRMVFDDCAGIWLQKIDAIRYMCSPVTKVGNEQHQEFDELPINATTITVSSILGRTSKQWTMNNLSSNVSSTTSNQIQENFEQELIAKEVEQIRTDNSTANWWFEEGYDDNNYHLIFFWLYFGDYSQIARGIDHLFPGINLCPGVNCTGKEWDSFECSQPSHDDRMIMIMRGRLPDPKLEILEARPIPIYLASNGSICKFTYTGPRYVVWNWQRNCTQSLEFQFKKEEFESETIPVPNPDHCDPREQTRTVVHFQPSLCYHRNEIFPEYLYNRIEIGNEVLVYCNFLELHFPSGSQINCSNQVYIISDSENYTVYDPVHQRALTDLSAHWLLVESVKHLFKAVNLTQVINSKLLIPGLYRLDESSHREIMAFNREQNGAIWTQLEQMQNSLDRINIVLVLLIIFLVIILFGGFSWYWIRRVDLRKFPAIPPMQIGRLSNSEAADSLIQ